MGHEKGIQCDKLTSLLNFIWKIIDVSSCVEKDFVASREVRITNNNNNTRKGWF